MSLDLSQVKKTAKLANIRMSESELNHMQNELNAIFQWIDQLQKIDCENVVLSKHQANYQGSLNVERPDEASDQNLVDEIFINAKDKTYNMFAVPKVVE
jgi:aspartyl-tRNA(Asn)/glutamyl-tRNA(Gln) amidotransferase subunit C